MKNKIGVIILGLAALALSACGSFGGDTPSSSQSEEQSESEIHVHTFSDEWTYNETKHWHASTCGHDVRSDEENHTFELREDMSTDYTTVEECSICHYRKETIIPHTWGTEWSKDSTHHCYEHLKKDYEEHTMEYDQESSTDYLYVEKCSICGYKTEVELEYSNTWSFNLDYHWHQCITEGYTSQRIDFGAHHFVTDTERSDDYTLVQVCDVCGMSISNPIIHNYDELNWEHNTTHHWHKCIDEGYEHLKKDYGEHMFYDDNHGGSVTHYCMICEYSYDEIYANTPISSSRNMTTKYYNNSGDLETLTSTIYFMNDTGDVPYVKFNDFYNSHYGLYWNSLNATQTKVGNDLYQYHCGLGDLFINPTLNTIYTDSANSFRTALAVNVANNTTFIANGIETNYISLNSKTKQVVERGAFSFDLGRYGIDIILYDETIYVPLQTFIDIFINNNGLSFAYNGKNLYDVSDFGNTLTGDVSDANSLEYEFYHDSPWYQQSTRETKLAQYTYNEFCFSMDNFYGLKEFRGITSFKDYFATNGYETDLKSTNSATYELAMARFVGAWMFEGHAGYTRVSPYQQNNSTVASTYSTARQSNPRYSLFTTQSALTQLRNNAGKGVGVSYSGSTAIITFDSFMKGRYWGTYTPDQFNYATWHKYDTEMFFHKAFDEIGTHSGISNVVIDITLNGGGMLDAIPWLEAYLTDDPFTLIRTKTTGEISEVHFTVDLDRNGTKGEATDTYKNRYNFFLMTSNFSFSCGNAFPTFVKAGNMATIIGETSGGGACAVGAIATASGTVLRSSSIFQMGYFVNNEFVLNENGIEPDYSFSRNNFYNDAAINSFVNGL